ncbi:hypothetical protein EDB85DRAFT_1886020 [Lactarius pseudohatsudake]|nr:hypothetical protein EDB85DRAFT_1886020 [Lactarius pseudohatsudake]
MLVWKSSFSSDTGPSECRMMRVRKTLPNEMTAKGSISYPVHVNCNLISTDAAKTTPLDLEQNNDNDVVVSIKLKRVVVVVVVLNWCELEEKSHLTIYVFSQCNGISHRGGKHKDAPSTRWDQGEGSEDHLGNGFKNTGSKRCQRRSFGRTNGPFNTCLERPYGLAWSLASAFKHTLSQRNPSYLDQNGDGTQEDDEKAVRRAEKKAAAAEQKERERAEKKAEKERLERERKELEKLEKEQVPWRARQNRRLSMCENRGKMLTASAVMADESDRMPVKAPDSWLVSLLTGKPQQIPDLAPVSSSVRSDVENVGPLEVRVAPTAGHSSIAAT